MIEYVEACHKNMYKEVLLYLFDIKLFWVEQYKYISQINYFNYFYHKIRST